ncbi:MAG: GTPase HflX [Caldiserica bacterium]|jgi:GTP-binding protein HflX|nr:GTPase HflX [Caldisericota bacterium]MDH7562867.1 GTPase HflX [Caldisericota bacterium]
MARTLKETREEKERALLISCELPERSEQDTWNLLYELKDLVVSAGGEVVDFVIQKRLSIDPRYYLGKGKMEEVRSLLKQSRANLVVCDDELTPSQVRILENFLQTKVLDRSQIILDLFARRAQSKEGKIQVELAQLEYLLPRLTGGRRWLSRLGGGIGTRGPGETKLELDRRLMRQRIHKLQEELKEVKKEREILRRSRRRKNFFTVSLLGYTNAGKSTLFSSLTGQETTISSRLFSTLDPKVRLLKGSGNILVSDTVGFIRKIPHHLFASFRATLEEAQEADLLLLVVDGSDPKAQEHIQLAREIIENLNLQEKQMITVINKVDLIQSRPWLDLLLKANHPAIAVSALKGDGLGNLISRLKELEERSRSVFLPS